MAAALNSSPTIARLPRQAPPTRFDALRADGIRSLQALAGSRWTDYNVHDPGVTLLEALCFALTDLAYRADFGVADQLSDAQQHIDWTRLALHLPETIFPCRPSTLLDMRRQLLDRLPELDGVWLSSAAPAGAGRWLAGLHSLVLDASSPSTAGDIARDARLAWCAMRNLGEDLGRVTVVDERPCRLLGSIEVAGARDPTDIVAELYERCAAYMAAAADFEGCGDGLRRGETLDEILSGPATRNGIARGAQLERATRQTLFVTDLIARARAVEGLSDVDWLALAPPDAPAAASSLPWRHPDGSWTLTLPPPAGDGALQDLTILRRGSVITVLAHEVRRRFEDLRAARRARRHGLGDVGLACPPPVGRYLPPAPYLSVQYQLPGNYGVGANGLPASASEADKARASQLQGYLLLFDQLLANGSAQLQHLRQLFGVEEGQPATYWWQVPDDDAAPGADTLLEGSAPTIEREVFAPFDERIERKSRLLDYLLALHGQTYVQNSLRLFSDHLTPLELETLLLKNKLAFVDALPALGRDRAGGFDYTQPSWNVPGNSSGLQRLVSLLLGFAQGYSRPLAAGLRQRELLSSEAFAAFERGAAPAAIAVPWRPAFVRLDLAAREARRSTAQMRDDLEQVALARRRRVSAALLRCAVRCDRYWTAPAPAGTGCILALGPDEDGRYWQLAEFATGDEDRALHCAASLRRFVMRLDADCEGMHVVEHVLLRPLSDARTGARDAVAATADDRDQGDRARGASPDPAFLTLQISVILPGWTARCRQRNIRRLAEESVRINCPAHLVATCLWLEPGPMRAFEHAYQAWLQARLALGVGSDVQALAEVDRRAAALARLLTALHAARHAQSPASPS